MSSGRSDAAEIEIRELFIEGMEKAGADCSYMYDKLLDYTEFSDFRYEAEKRALMAAGITTEDLPRLPQDAGAASRKSMDDRFASNFSDGREKFNTDNLFIECRDVREKLAKLTVLTETQLVAVYDDMRVEFVVRKYAAALLHSDIKDTNSILDQALGKPLERTVSMTATVSPLDGLSTEEIRALLGTGESPDAAEIIEVEDQS